MGSQIPNIELLTEENLQSEQRQAKSDFEKLGNSESGSAMYSLQNILLTDTTFEKDEFMNSLLEYRHQYTLKMLLEFVNPEKKESEYSGDPVLREINTMAILTNIYPKLLQIRPDSALTIAKGFCKKLEAQTELPWAPSSYPGDKESKEERQRTQALLGFFRTTGTSVDLQSEEITINTFKSLLQNINKTDFMSFSNAFDILGGYFKSTIQKQNYELFKHLTQTLFTTMDPLYPDEEENKKIFEVEAYLYRYIFSLTSVLPLTMQFDIRKQIFERSSAIASNPLNFGSTRYSHLSFLRSVISKDKRWESHPKILEQAISFHMKTLAIAKSILKEEAPEERPQGEAFDLLGELLEQYAHGASGWDSNWVEISKKHSPKFKDGLKLYLEGLNSKEERTRRHTFDSLDKILNISELNNPNHPFHREGILFFHKYFSEKAKGLE